ncbi:MAG TPA: PQQ-dependent sugar dehydrogenase [Vicinamibacterales bacterium]|nr:PQQ-dependent sugar dehydrogenase [Vicinamibacterales bacterium]
MRVMSLSALLSGVVVAVLQAAQPGPPQLSPEAQELAKRFPYPVVRDMRGVVPPGPRPLPSPPLGDGPWVFSTLEQRDVKVSVIARGFSHPWSLAFLPDGGILITERAGRLRLVRNGVLEATPLAGIPTVLSRATMAGLMDIALHPDFAHTHWIYISYHKPLAPGVAANAILRATWEGGALTGVRDVFVSDDVDTEASRIAFGADGMLYMGIGGPGTGPPVSVDRAQHTNDLAGKILRLRDDGSVPADNPFVGRSGYQPAIFTIGHRVQLGLALNPFTGEIWEDENGPNGGDELNVLKAGRNYGWPIVSYGRDYNGPRFPPTAPGFEEPVVFWVPSIAASGLAFYTGDRFPAWTRNAFVGGLREGEVAPSGQLQRIVFNDKWEELRREPLLRELHQRIRDVRQGPDGLLYLLTDEDPAALLRIEPVAPPSSAVH